MPKLLAHYKTMPTDAHVPVFLKSLHKSKWAVIHGSATGKAIVAVEVPLNKPDAEPASGHFNHSPGELIEHTLVADKNQQPYPRGTCNICVERALTIPGTNQHLSFKIVGSHGLRGCRAFRRWL